MEIIQSFTWDEASVHAISDGSRIHLVDENDLDEAIENPTVGTVVRASQIGDKYMQIPITELQEMARRSQAHVEPDPVEDTEEETSDEEEASGPPDWKPLATTQFLEEYSSLREGQRRDFTVQVHVFDDLSGDLAPAITFTNGTQTTLSQSLIADDPAFLAMRENIENRMRILATTVQEFCREQNELGHEIDQALVYAHLNEVVTSATEESVAEAAE